MAIFCAHLIVTLALVAAKTADVPADRMLDAFEARRNQQAVRLARVVLDRLEEGEEGRDLIDGGGDIQTVAVQARLVEAIASIRMKRFRDARPLLAELRSDGPDLGNYIVFLQVMVTAAARECPEAEALAGELPAASVFHGQSWGRVASCWIAADDAEKARIALASFELGADSDQRRAAADILRGRILEIENSLAAARDSYRDVLVTYPNTSMVRTAKDRLRALRRRGLRSMPPLPEELLAQANVERGRHHASLAKRLYLELKQGVAAQVRKMKTRGKKRNELRAVYQKAELGLIEIDITNRDYRTALKRASALVYARDPDVKARALYLKGDIQARRGNLAHSLKTFNRLIDRAPGHPFAMEAALSAARMAYSARYLYKARSFAQWIVSNSEEARVDTVVGEDGVYRGADVRGHPRDHGYWLMAWNERRSGAVPEVMDSYLRQIDPNGPLGDAALYWRARLALNADDIEMAEVFVEMLRTKAPASYYALVADDLLAQVGGRERRRPDLPTIEIALAEAGEYPQPTGAAPDMQGPMVLANYGLLSEARDILRSVPVMTLTGGDRIAASWLYHRCGEQHLAAILARNAVLGTRDEVQDPALFHLAFPRAFAEIVDEYAGRYGVPNDLLYAIIREESGFNPLAQSPRYARGLMQMIRPTARRMAEEVDFKHFSSRKLFDPEVSIQLGTHYIAHLLEKFDGNIVAAIASYHAGEERVARWLKTRTHLTPDEFIEDIPYATTRGYVMKVLGSYGIYRLLYSNETDSTIGLSLSMTIEQWHAARAMMARESVGQLAQRGE